MATTHVAAPAYGALLDALRGVHWPARKRVPAALSGTHPSRARGTSPELLEYRPYRQGDDPRRIDYKLLARSDRAYIRLANERAILETVIIVDGSASMAFPVDTLGKWTQAKRVAVGLGQVAHGDGDPVALSVAARAVVRLPARTRRGVVAQMARMLDEVSPGGPSSLVEALRVVRNGARIVVISDFLDWGREGAASPDLMMVVKRHLAAGGEAHAVHVVSRAEIEPSRTGMTAVDPEDANIKRTLVGATRDAYLDAFAQWRSDLAAAWRSAGGTYAITVDDEPAEHAVRRIVRGEGSATGEEARG